MTLNRNFGPSLENIQSTGMKGMECRIFLALAKQSGISKGVENVGVKFESNAAMTKPSAASMRLRCNHYE
jgi:hypothetical protein